MARRTGPALAVADLLDRRVSTGPEDSGTDIVAHRILEWAGIDRTISRHRLGVADSAVALLGERLDAFFFAGGLGTPAIADLASQTRIQVLSLGPLVDTLSDQYNGLRAVRRRRAAPIAHDAAARSGVTVAAGGRTGQLRARPRVAFVCAGSAGGSAGVRPAAAARW